MSGIISNRLTSARKACSADSIQAPTARQSVTMKDSLQINGDPKLGEKQCALGQIQDSVQTPRHIPRSISTGSSITPNVTATTLSSNCKSTSAHWSVITECNPATLCFASHSLVWPSRPSRRKPAGEMKENRLLPEHARVLTN